MHLSKENPSVKFSNNNCNPSSIIGHILFRDTFFNFSRCVDMVMIKVGFMIITKLPNNVYKFFDLKVFLELCSWFYVRGLCV